MNFYTRLYEFEVPQKKLFMFISPLFSIIRFFMYKQSAKATNQKKIHLVQV